MTPNEVSERKVPVKSEKGGERGALSPFEPLFDLRRGIDRLFDDFFTGWPAPFGRRFLDMEPFRRLEPMARGLAPDIDVAETDSEITVSAELPGMDKDDVKLSLSDEVLTISGEKKFEEERKEKNYYLSERRYGSFQRSFRLPETVDRDKIDASFEKGVLTVILPKTEKAKAKQKQIEIKAK
jgi:HSP20 family protein